MNKSKLKKITSARLFLPIVCLIAVLLLNVIKTPDFFNVSIRNGVLYGYIIDVINRASELVILAIGMTLVTAASGGQDISVGAIMAVAAAVCCQILSGGQVSVNEYQNSIIIAVIAALLASALCGAFNGFLVPDLRGAYSGEISDTGSVAGSVDKSFDNIPIDVGEIDRLVGRLRVSQSADGGDSLSAVSGDIDEITVPE